MTRPVHTAPGNDYRNIADLPPHGPVRLTVIVPAYNRAALLQRTLAGLANQTLGRDAYDVVVVDDGSTENIAATATPFEDALQLEVVRQDRDGYGAGRARNHGAARATGDILLFLDSDCIPTPQAVERHLWWHRRASNIAVVGSRRDIDSTTLMPDAIQTGRADLWRLAGSDSKQPPPPQGWRSLFYRRTRRLLLGQAPFRAGLTANLSVPSPMFHAVGGFDTGFASWGGEDTELAWRLWNEGMFFVPDDRALVLHQIQHDQTDRESGREATLPRVMDRVPHPFYRSHPSHLATVPRVSWMIHIDSDDDPLLALTMATQGGFPDSDLVVWGAHDRMGAFRDALSGNPRVTIVEGDDPASARVALAATRGELLVITTTSQRVPKRSIARAVQRFDDKDAATTVRFSYIISGDRYLRLNDLRAIDQELGLHGLPLFAVVRRRELMKHVYASERVDQAWAQCAADVTNTELFISDGVGVAGSAWEKRPHPPGRHELSAVDPKEVARAVARRYRERRSGSTGQGPAADLDDRIGVEYVGLTGKQNLGDDAVQLAIERLMPWARIGRDISDPRLLMVGGGTLLNGRRYYLTRMQRQDSPYLDRCLFGTGVRSPGYWGVTEPMDDWFSFMDSALHVSVRGPDSVANLRELGYEGDVQVIGDPALSLTAPTDTSRVEGRVVVCPVWTSGNLHGGSDEAVFSALARHISGLRSSGHDVIMLSAFPEDDRWILRLMREAGHPDLAYEDGYADVDRTLSLLASADLVIAERLHAAILAAAVGTPFVALEYRPKVRDFARSVEQEDATIRTDEMPRLHDVVEHVLATADQRRQVVNRHVEAYRHLHREAAEHLYQQLAEPDAHG